MEKSLNLVLGCFGDRDDDFVICNAIENSILQIDTRIHNYNKLMDYLANCQLFDKACFDLNAIRHMLYNIRDNFEQPSKPLWLPKRFHKFEKFLADHRSCGLYLKLALGGEPVVYTDKSVFIAAEKPPEPHPINKLRIIRGRDG